MHEMQVKIAESHCLIHGLDVINYLIPLSRLYPQSLIVNL